MGVGLSGSKSSQSSKSSATSMPIIPEDWLTDYKTLHGTIADGGLNLDQNQAADVFRGQVGRGTGLTPDQETAAGYFRGNVTGGGNLPLLQDFNRSYWNEFAARGANTLGAAARQAEAGVPGWESYGAPTPVAAQTVAAPSISASQGAKFLADYENPYTSDVVNASLGDLRNAYDRGMVNSGMAAAAGGAFGGGRHAIREAQMADDYLRNVAGTSANLRNQGFNTAAGFGMQDANRFLQADTTNAGNALSASQANAANALAAATFNSNLLNSRQQFDINAANESQRLRMDALKGAEANAALQDALGSGNALNLFNTGAADFGQISNAASNLFGAGSTGFQQPMDWLKLGTARFGNKSDSTSSGKSSQLGASYGGK